MWGSSVHVRMSVCGVYGVFTILKTVHFLDLFIFSQVALKYVDTSLFWTSFIIQDQVSSLERCPYFRDSFVHISM